MINIFFYIYSFEQLLALNDDINFADEDEELQSPSMGMYK